MYDAIIRELKLALMLDGADDNRVFYAKPESVFAERFVSFSNPPLQLNICSAKSRALGNSRGVFQFRKGPAVSPLFHEVAITGESPIIGSAYIIVFLPNGRNLLEIPLGHWIVKLSKSDSFIVMSDEQFRERFMVESDSSILHH